MRAIRIKRIRRGRLVVLVAVACVALVGTASGAAVPVRLRTRRGVPAAQAHASGPAHRSARVPAHLPPDGGGPVEEMARYDMVVGSTSISAAALRLRNPAGIFLLQPTINGRHVHVTAPGGAVGWTGATDSLSGGKTAWRDPRRQR